MTAILAIETSTDACSAALWQKDHMEERFAIALRQHSQLILQMVDEVLSVSGVSLSRLDAIAFGCGPGSFMGVRLATGVAQALAFANNLPIIPVSSLQALAQRAFDQLGQSYIAAAWDARMQEVYWGCYQLEAGLMMPLIEDQLCSPSAIRLPGPHAWTLAGNAWQAYQADLPDVLQLDSELIHPSAAAVATLADYYLSKGASVSVEAALPNYLRQRVANRRS